MKIKKQNNKWFFTADIGSGLNMQYQFARLQSAIYEAIELKNQGEIKWDELTIDTSYTDILNEMEIIYQDGITMGEHDRG